MLFHVDLKFTRMVLDRWAIAPLGVKRKCDHTKGPGQHPAPLLLTSESTWKDVGRSDQIPNPVAQSV